MFCLFVAGGDTGTSQPADLQRVQHEKIPQHEETEEIEEQLTEEEGSEHSMKTDTQENEGWANDEGRDKAWKKAKESVKTYRLPW